MHMTDKYYYVLFGIGGWWDNINNPLQDDSAFPLLTACESCVTGK